MVVWSKKIEGDILEVVDVQADKVLYVYVNLITWLRTLRGIQGETPSVPCTPAARAFIEKYYLQCELSENYFNPLLTR